MRLFRSCLLALVLAVPALCTAAGTPILTVSSPQKTLTYTADEFAALPHIDLTLPARGDQPEVHFSGVAMHELLARAGAPFGNKMRGAGLMTGVIVRCKDHYAVLFSLAEFDQNFSDRTILLADKEDGDILPPSAAPLRMVTPGDKRGARSCKQVVSIEIVSLAKS